MTLATLRRHRTLQALGAWLLAFSQVFWAAGCRQSTGSGKAATAGSTAAGATAGPNVGEILYQTLHHTYETEGETAKATVLQRRKSEFVAAVNRLLPNGSSQNLFPTLLSLLPLVDDGTVDLALADVDGIIADLLNDPTALNGIATLLGGTGGPRAPSDPAANRATFTLISRLLAYPEFDGMARALFQLVRENDGVDDNGDPNGEKNLFRALRSMLADLLVNYQASPNTGQNVAQSLYKLSGALLSASPLKAFPDLGAPAWSVRLDVNGNPKVLADPATGDLPLPFVDFDNDGVADVNGFGQPVDGSAIAISIAPFGEDGARDSYGRALAPGGGAYYEYYDVKRTFLSEILLLVGELLQRNVLTRGVSVLDALADRVRNDNGTPGDVSDDYDTLAPDSPILDLSWAGLEMMKRTPLPGLLKGTAQVVKQDPQKFGQILDTLLVALSQASSAASTVPPQAGAGTDLLNDLLPLLEDSLRPRGRSTSAMRALLQAFNAEQRRLKNLPATMAKMVQWSDYARRIPSDANNKSALQQVLEMMERANGCNGGFGLGNMADFYLDAMAGNQRILGIDISISTINRLLDISILRNLLCSAIQPSDVRALKAFSDTGMLDAMKPIAKVFSDRGETPLLKNIMLGLGKHYDGVLRPTEQTLIAVMNSGAIEKLFEVIDAMTQVPVPGTNDKVADALADVLQVMVDSSRPIVDRRGRTARTLFHLLLQPLDDLQQVAAAKNVGPELDALIHDAADILLALHTDDRGTPDPSDDVTQWKWESLKAQLGSTLEFVADTLPDTDAGRAQWAAQMQIDVEHMLTGPALVTVMDLLTTIGASPHKATLTAGLVNLFTPRANTQEDVFGAILILTSEVVAKKPTNAPATIDAQALEDVLHFVGRELDPAAGRFGGLGTLVLRILALDDGLFILNLARNAFDMGPNGVLTPPVMVLQSIFDEISSVGAAGSPLTAASLEATLNDVRAMLAPGGSVAEIVTKLKNRP